MATVPGGMADFEMGPSAFNVDRVTAEIIWPLVNHGWRGENIHGGDWLQDTEAGDMISKSTFIKRKIDGHKIHVLLEACTFDVVEPEEDDEVERDERFIDDPSVAHSALIRIEEEPTRGVREVLAATAREQIQRINKAERDRRGQSELTTWPQGEYDQIVIKNINNYSFDDSGGWGDPHFILVEGADKRLEIPFASCTESPDFEMRLADIEAIELACQILRAPKAVMTAIKLIKENPVRSDCWKN